MAPKPIDTLDDLFIAADKIEADYADFKTEIVNLRAKIRTLPQMEQVFSHPDSKQLLKEVRKQQANIDYVKLSRISKPTLYACVCASMIMMFLVGAYSLAYTRGLDLLSKIESVAAKQPSRRFGELERQLLAAKEQLFIAGVQPAVPAPNGSTTPNGNGTSTPRDDLAKESAYLTWHELKDLNVELKSLESRVGDFEIEWNDRSVHGVVRNGVKAAYHYFSGTDAPEKEAPKPDAMVLACSEYAKGSGQAGKAKFILGMDMAKIVGQACESSLNYVASTVPPVEIWGLRIKEVIDPFGVWVLPALYAALGCLLYYMRLIFDPEQHNPTLSRIIHRVALATLAGMIVAWFWQPAFSGNETFKAVGFGVFTFAFIVGFSIDIFFALLDRLVALSNAAIERIGANK